MYQRPSSRLAQGVMFLTVVGFLHCMTFARASSGAASDAGFANHKLTAKLMPVPPALDGELDDHCWDACVWVPLLPENDAPIAAPTMVAAGHDGQNLYLAFDCFLADLHPVRNMLEEVMPRTTADNDRNVFVDDHVEVFIAREYNTQNYIHFAVNGHGAIYAQIVKGELRASAEAHKIKAAGIIKNDDERWRLEVQVPLDIVPGAAMGTNVVFFNLFRQFEKNNIVSALAPVGGGFHAPEKFAMLRLDEDVSNSPGIQLNDIKLSGGYIGGAILNRSEIPAVYTVAASKADVCMTNIEINCRPVTVERFALQGWPSNLAPDRLRIDASNVNLVSFAVPITDSLPTARLNLVISNTATTIFWNGKLISGADRIDAVVNILPGVNTLALELDKPSVDTILDGWLEYSGGKIPLDIWLASASPADQWADNKYDDAQWEIVTLADIGRQEKTLRLRRNFISGHTIFAPQWEADNTHGYFAQGAMQHVGVRFGAPFKYAVSGMVFNLSLPTSLTIPLYDRENHIYAKKYPSKMTSKSNALGNHYRFVFDGSIPSLPYNFGMHVMHLYLKADVYGDGMLRHEEAGRAWFEWRNGADIELANPLRFTMLPTPRGKQPEKIWMEVAQTHIGMNISEAESTQFIPSLAKCGFNVVFTDPASPVFNEKLKDAGFTIQAHISPYFYITSPLRDLLKPVLDREPRAALVNTKYQAPKWRTTACPLYFMNEAAAALKHAVRIQAEEQKVDVFCYDLEIKPCASCFCERCRRAFAAYMKTDTLYSQDEILADYADAWIDYVCLINRDIVLCYRKIIDEVAQEIKRELRFSIYSGYGDAARSKYGANWELYRDVFDIFSAGYGMNPDVIRQTRAQIGNAPLVVGIHPYTRMFEHKYTIQQQLKPLIFRALIYGGMRGTLIWSMSAQLDGRGLVAVADATRAIADCEAILLTGENATLQGRCHGIPSGDVFAYGSDHAGVLVLFNETSAVPRDYSVKFPDGAQYLVSDCVGGTSVACHGEYLGRIPAKEMMVLKIIQCNAAL